MQSIPKGLGRDHILLALADLDVGIQHPFGEPTKYELAYQNKRYAPKAVVGLAVKHFLGTILGPQQFSGGEAPGQANFVLRQLGFTVISKGEDADIDDRKPWSADEVNRVVVDYFEMLRQEMLDEPYSKTEHRRALRPLLSGRSNGSVEFKHQNISAVLAGMGLPYIVGYKPRGNYQNLLALEIESYLTNHPGYLSLIATSQMVAPAGAPAVDIADPQSRFDDPPDLVAMPASGSPWLTRKAVRINFAERDAADRKLGRLGEEFIVELERMRLRRLGRDDLARRVDWVADTVGDGLGFDVLSFDEADESEQFVEVKTTGLGKYHPFYVTATEVRCSEDVPERFHLYRVFDFARDPRVYVLPGSLRERCLLDPLQYRAAPQTTVAASSNR